jgi:hypothetical protein
MVTPERRPALGSRKLPRAHPISPEAAAETAAPQRSGAPPGVVRAAEVPVMLCVRVAASLRRRLKLLAAQTGTPVQQLAAAALEAECRRYDA